MKDIGKKIRQLREMQGMTQEELAHKVGYKSRVSINKIELQRDVPLKKIVPIANALGISPSELTGWDEEEHNHTEYNNLIETILSEMSEYKDNKELVEKGKLILDYFAQLNEDGLIEAMKRLQELTELSKYKK